MSIKVEQIDEFSPIENLDMYRLHEVMTSGKITADQKISFMEKNHAEISNIVDNRISGKDFRKMMKNRPLNIYGPLKNSYTKAGDKKLLAIALEISPKDVDKYIKDKTEKIHTMQELSAIGMTKDEYDEVKAYVFRHGTKEQVIDYFNYELAHAKNILVMLYHILKYNSGGVADYFLRPIHKLDNLTMIKLYNTVDRNLKVCQKKGKINEAEASETAEWALARIYKIQNNQKFKNAIKLKHILME